LYLLIGLMVGFFVAVLAAICSSFFCYYSCWKDSTEEHHQHQHRHDIDFGVESNTTIQVHPVTNYVSRAQAADLQRQLELSHLAHVDPMEADRVDAHIRGRKDISRQVVTVARPRQTGPQHHLPEAAQAVGDDGLHHTRVVVPMLELGALSCDANGTAHTSRTTGRAGGNQTGRQQSGRQSARQGGGGGGIIDSVDAIVDRIMSSSRGDITSRSSSNTVSRTASQSQPSSRTASRSARTSISGSGSGGLTSRTLSAGAYGGYEGDNDVVVVAARSNDNYDSGYERPPVSARSPDNRPGTNYDSALMSARLLTAPSSDNYHDYYAAAALSARSTDRGPLPAPRGGAPSYPPPVTDAGPLPAPRGGAPSYPLPINSGRSSGRADYPPPTPQFTAAGMAPVAECNHTSRSSDFYANRQQQSFRNNSNSKSYSNSNSNSRSASSGGHTPPESARDRSGYVDNMPVVYNTNSQQSSSRLSSGRQMSGRQTSSRSNSTASSSRSRHSYEALNGTGEEYRDDWQTNNNV
jgi:hypothetical protein